MAALLIKLDQPKHENVGNLSKIGVHTSSPCDMDRVTTLHCGGCSNTNDFSCMQNVLKLCKTFSKLNCVSLISMQKWKSSSNSEWHKNC